VFFPGQTLPVRITHVDPDTRRLRASFRVRACTPLSFLMCWCLPFLYIVRACDPTEAPLHTILLVSACGRFCSAALSVCRDALVAIGPRATYPG
jgi:hypothetical protein